MKQSWHTQRMVVYRGPIANISSAPSSNAENAKPETAVLFAKNQTKGTFAPVTETDFHFKTTFLRVARRVFATKSCLVVSKNAKYCITRRRLANTMFAA